MDKRIKELMEYLDSAKSVFHAVAGLKALLEKEGYVLHSNYGKTLEVYRKAK